MSTEILKNSEKKFYIGNNLRQLRNNSSLTLESFCNLNKINFDTARNYEAGNINPVLETIIKISCFYNVSLDFMIRWNDTNYAHNLKLVSLALQFDTLDQLKRFQIESTATALLNIADDNFDIKMDQFIAELTDNIHENIKILREIRDVSQYEIANLLETKQGVVSRYEKQVTPSFDKIIKLSDFFGVSIHALTTGQKLSFDFQDRQFGKTMLSADKFLTLEDQKVLIRLMEAVLDANKT